MKFINNIRYYSYCDSVTLYWEKNAPQPTGSVYQVFLNQKYAGTSDTTAFRFNGLMPDTGYIAAVQLLPAESAGSAGSAASPARVPEPVFNDQKAIEAVQIVIRTDHEKDKIDITKAPYLAVDDGKTLNTMAIQKAIDACGPDQAVVIPAGTFLTGTLHLHSHMELIIEKEGRLLGSSNPDDYLPKTRSRFEGTELDVYSPMIGLGTIDRDGGYNCTDVKIHGEGSIIGGGQELGWNVIRREQENMKEELAALGVRIAEYEKPETIPGRRRPRLLQICNSRDIIIDGLTLGYGACWNLHMIYSSHIVTSNCTILSEGVWNGDGWDPDSSSDCVLFNSAFRTGDDAVAIKSGKNPEGNLVNRPTTGVRIFHCSGTFGGGISIGSEMSGGVDDVLVWDCDFTPAGSGLLIKAAVKRGGYVRNVHCLDSLFSHISFISAVNYNNDGEGAKVPPLFKDCLFEHCAATGVRRDNDGKYTHHPAILISGFAKPGCEIRNVVFRDIALGCKTADEEAAESGSEPEASRIELQYCDGVTMENLHTVR